MLTSSLWLCILMGVKGCLNNQVKQKNVLTFLKTFWRLYNMNIIGIYLAFLYALANLCIGFFTIHTFATTIVFADMQRYDAFVCMVGSIFILWGMLVIGRIVLK